MRLRFALAVGYLAAMATWIYGVVDRSVGYGSDVAAGVGISALAAFHIVIGAFVGRGWAPLLVLAVPLIAYPAGYADRGENLVWLGSAYTVPVGMLLVFAGVALGQLVRDRRARIA